MNTKPTNKTRFAPEERWKLILVSPDGVRTDSMIKGACLMSKREARFVLKTYSPRLATGWTFDIEPVMKQDANARNVHNETRKWKAVAYAYPTSQNAVDFGFGKEGCFVVEISTSRDRIPQAIAGFKTSKEAFDFANTLKDHELSQYSVSPEFRVYTPHVSTTAT